MPAKLLAIAFCVSICTLGALGTSKVPSVVSCADFVRVERDESPASKYGGEHSSELTKPPATELTKPLAAEQASAERGLATVRENPLLRCALVKVGC